MLILNKYTQRAKLILIGPSEFSISPERDISTQSASQRILSSGKKMFCFSAIGLTEITNELIMAFFDKSV